MSQHKWRLPKPNHAPASQPPQPLVHCITNTTTTTTTRFRTLPSTCSSILWPTSSLHSRYSTPPALQQLVHGVEWSSYLAPTSHYTSEPRPRQAAEFSLAAEASKETHSKWAAKGGAWTGGCWAELSG